MRLRLIILIVPAIFALSCTSSVKDVLKNDEKIEKTDWQDYNLKGEVKSLDETCYFADEPMDLEESIKSRLYVTFSNTGSYIEKSLFGVEDNMIYTEEYQYNDEFLLERIRRTDIEGTCYGICVCNYDDNGNINMQSEYNCEDVLQYNIKITRDDENRVVEMSYLRPDEKENFVIITKKYDSEGNISEMSNMDVLNNIHIVKKFKYDKDGNKIIEEKYSRGIELLEKLSFEYDFDDKGNWITCYEKNQNVVVFIVKRKIEYFE